MNNQVHVILNLRSGTIGGEHAVIQSIRELLTGRGARAEINVAHTGNELARLARRAVADGVDQVIAGGGDGTIGTVAAEMVWTEIPLGILPLGTLNHFAKDLNLPSAVDEAIDVALNGNAVYVDVGAVNDRYFINNSSLGWYPNIVVEREQRRPLLGKWPAMLVSTIKVLKHYQSFQARLYVNGREIVRRSPLIFIGNNLYRLDLLFLGARERLDSGLLSIFLLHEMTRADFITLAARAVKAELKQAEHFEILQATELWIETNRRRMRVAVDGEVVRLRTPLHYRILPRSLKVKALKSSPARQAQDQEI